MKKDLQKVTKHECTKGGCRNTMVTIEQLYNKDICVMVVGLGYVGLPLLIQLAHHFPAIGFDISKRRIHELLRKYDRTGEISSEILDNTKASFSYNQTDIHQADIIIIAVPTPIDTYRNPDFTPLINATQMVARHMRQGCVVVYESTVYPGATEEICIPLLEKVSGLSYLNDFTVGYSPERINPGDTIHTLENIVKVVSGSNKATTDLLTALYGTFIQAGIHKTSSLKVAEAAKVIENTQRDLNIALMNELAIIFDKLDIDTLEVLEAAGTKWNFLPFRPGLVGGHCIGVDPYYLTRKAEEVGYHPQVILAGRRINDEMGKYIAETCIKLLIKKNVLINKARVGILGLTFKEDVSDLRNTKVIDIVNELKEFGVTPLVHDPLVDAEDALKEYQIIIEEFSAFKQLDALILAVPHKIYLHLQPQELLSCFKNINSAVLMDIKGRLDPSDFTEDVLFWRL